MVAIFITSEEITKYIYLIILFNAVFPKVLETSGLMINIDMLDGYRQTLTYDHFIYLYDHYGLAQVAE